MNTQEHTTQDTNGDTQAASKLQALLAASPATKRRRFRRAERIANIGKFDVEKMMDKRANARQYQPSSVKFLHTTLEVAGTYKTTPSPKHAAKHRNVKDTRVHATMPITYSTKIAHYFTQHSVTIYFDRAVNAKGYRKVDATAIILQAAREEA